VVAAWLVFRQEVKGYDLSVLARDLRKTAVTMQWTSVGSSNYSSTSRGHIGNTMAREDMER